MSPRAELARDILLAMVNGTHESLLHPDQLVELAFRIATEFLVLANADEAEHSRLRR